MVLPIRPIGFDAPQQQRIAVTGAQSLPQADNTAMQILNQASQRLDQSIQFDTQVAQQQAQAVAQTQQAAVQTSQSLAQTSMLMAQTSANEAQQTAQSASVLGESISRIAQTYSQRQAKEAELLAKAQESAAVRALEDVRIEWIEQGRIDKEGTQAYRDAVAETIGGYAVTPETIGNLTQQYYAPALDYAKRTEQNRQEALSKAADQQRRITSQELQNKFSVYLAALRSSAVMSPDDITRNVGEIKTHIAAMIGDQSVPLEDRLFAVANALEVTNEAMLKRNIHSAEFNATLAGVRELRKLEAELLPNVRSGQVPYSTYRAQVEARALELGISDFKITDPQEDAKVVRDVLQMNRDIRTAQQELFVDNLNTIEVTDNTIGALVTQFALSPSSYAAVKGDKALSQEPNNRQALKVYEEWEEFRKTEQPRFALDIQQRKTQIANLQSEFDTWYVEASRQARQGQQQMTPARILESLRGFDSNLAQQVQGKPLSEEDVNRVYQAYTRRAQAVSEELSTYQQNYNNRYQYFRNYGLSLDVGELKAAHNKRKKALSDHQQRIEQLRTEQLQLQQVPGNAPANFRGAVLTRKPLAVANYGGQRIAMPFTQDVAATLSLADGQRFGAFRTKDRNHAGLDFAVPVGTPVLSMVSGRITEVTGNADGIGVSVIVASDDGYQYRFGHNSRILAVQGQRVSSGDVIALSGNTQGSGGLSTGPHVHLEVYDPNGAAIDPLAHLGSRDFSKPVQPRTSGNNISRTAQPSVPVGAIPLGNNKYLLNSQVITINPQGQQTQSSPAGYSTNNPLRRSYAGGRKPNAGIDSPHGYAQLSADSKFTRALNTLARKYNLEPEWLADLIAHETANTFDPAIPNGSGDYGLIGFGPGIRQDLGISVEQLRRMSRVEQLKLVDRYFQLQLQYADLSDIRTPQELAAIVYMGWTGFKELRETGRLGSELREYVGKMGRFGGRQYDNSRSRRSSTVIHERLAAGCAMCASMSSSNQFHVHESIA